MVLANFLEIHWGLADMVEPKTKGHNKQKTDKQELKYRFPEEGLYFDHLGLSLAALSLRFS